MTKMMILPAILLSIVVDITQAQQTNNGPTFESARHFELRGNEGGGGGDPDAVDFLLTVKTFSHWVTESHFGFTMLEKEKIESVYQRLSQGMNHQAMTPIQFSDQTLTDLSGANKIAIFAKQPLLIKVNRASWKKLSPQEKFILISLEVLGLSDIENRYDIASKVMTSIGNLSSLKNDLHLTNLIVGSWRLTSGACLSGRPVHWGNDQNTLDGYEYTLTLKTDSTFTNAMLHKDNVLYSGKGSFSVKNANLFLNTSESCRYDSPGEPCEAQLDNEANGLLSVQKNQLWILFNQGRLGGSCDPQDVFIMKLDRK